MRADKIACFKLDKCIVIVDLECRIATGAVFTIVGRQDGVDFVAVVLFFAVVISTAVAKELIVVDSFAIVGN